MDKFDLNEIEGFGRRNKRWIIADVALIGALILFVFERSGVMDTLVEELAAVIVAIRAW